MLSQQLGIVWRSVPRSVKNRYDEEAAKLVKIHQMEFPNYKYQPKKRGMVVDSAGGSANNSTLTVSNNVESSPVSLQQQHASLTGGYSPEPWRVQDSAYSSRKNSCTSSTEFPSTPVKQPHQSMIQPLRRVIFDEHQQPLVRQRYASATSQRPVNVMVRQPRPNSCLLNHANRVLKREHEPFGEQYQTLFSSINASNSPKRRSTFLENEQSAFSLPELFGSQTLLGSGNHRGVEDDEEFSYFESTTESESILSEENILFDDTSSMMDLADFLPGAEELILGVEPFASGTLSPDLEMLDKNELLKL